MKLDSFKTNIKKERTFDIYVAFPNNPTGTVHDEIVNSVNINLGTRYFIKGFDINSEETNQKDDKPKNGLIEIEGDLEKVLEEYTKHVHDFSEKGYNVELRDVDPKVLGVKDNGLKYDTIQKSIFYQIQKITDNIQERYGIIKNRQTCIVVPKRPWAIDDYYKELFSKK